MHSGWRKFSSSKLCVGRVKLEERGKKMGKGDDRHGIAGFGPIFHARIHLEGYDGRSGRVRVRGILKTVRAVRVVCSSLLKSRKDGERGAIENGGEVDGERATATSQPGTTGEKKGKKSELLLAPRTKHRRPPPFHFKTLRGWHRFAHPSNPRSLRWAAHPLLYACEIRVNRTRVS